ncbi:MAG TPA: methylenetetrahydrofolate reductase [Candidatus Saccharimonadales bacterium]|nr:methylenetetrahydrofolate reductase [Candidatus Saccharimonadales bacterium]
MPGIPDLLRTKETCSFEFLPPRNQEQADSLPRTIGELAAATHPDFISVTQGAAGSLATQRLAIDLSDRFPFPTMAHLTCVGHTHQGMLDLLGTYHEGGVRNVLALRGDGDASGDFEYAVDLVELIKSLPYGMSVGVAAHPEVHPLSPDRQQDRRRLAQKLRVADFAITQFFFDAALYRQLVDEMAGQGCDKPIIPGIMLFSSVNGLRRVAEMNGTTIPAGLNQQLDRISSSADLSRLAVDTAASLIDDLRRDGVPGLHIYTMNRSGPAIELTKLISY